MRIAYLECFSGLSGDMFLGALVDAGVSLDLLNETAGALNIGAHLHARKVSRGGIAGTKADVHTAESATAAHSHDHTHANDHAHEHDHAHDHAPARDHDHAHGHNHDHAHDHRSLSTILKIIEAATLPEPVKQNAARAFQLLGEAEAVIHQIPVEKVHFHEVGAVDTIVDIVCAAAGAHALGIDRWLASNINVGSGTVQCAHGTLPVPAPATLTLLGNAPVYASGSPMERVTPTGATILRMLNVEYAPLPPLRIQASGYGAGGKDVPGEPNLVRLLIGEQFSPTVESAPQPEEIAILECVIDDSTPQLLAYVSEILLASGAWDVYRIPVQMKKGRTGFQFTVLCAPDRVAPLREILFRETTTIGVHWRTEHKMALPREFATVETPWGPVRIKIARSTSGEILNASPEYEDCRRIAEQRRVPLKEVLLQASSLFQQRSSR
jgi:hypothetical protein